MTGTSIDALTTSDIETDASNVQADGSASVGTSGKVVYSDHVHPTSAGLSTVSTQSVSPPTGEVYTVLELESPGTYENAYVVFSAFGNMPESGPASATWGFAGATVSVDDTSGDGFQAIGFATYTGSEWFGSISVRTSSGLLVSGVGGADAPLVFSIDIVADDENPFIAGACIQQVV
jgi:hypothetical protein